MEFSLGGAFLAHGFAAFGRGFDFGFPCFKRCGLAKIGRFVMMKQLSDGADQVLACIRIAKFLGFVQVVQVDDEILPSARVHCRDDERCLERAQFFDFLLPLGLNFRGEI